MPVDRCVCAAGICMCPGRVLLLLWYFEESRAWPSFGYLAFDSCQNYKMPVGWAAGCACQQGSSSVRVHVCTCVCMCVCTYVCVCVRAFVIVQTGVVYRWANAFIQTKKSFGMTCPCTHICEWAYTGLEQSPGKRRGVSDEDGEEC